MTEKEFKKAVTKSNWFDKYYYYFISIAIIAVGLLFLYLAFSESAGGRSISTRLVIISGAAFFFTLGFVVLRLLPNRYRILKFKSNLPAEKKEQVIANTMRELGATFFLNSQHLWRFYYRRKWWTFDYDLYLSFNNETIFVAVIGRTHGRGGFIDFGLTGKFRKRVAISIIEELARYEDASKMLKRITER
jgi:hypothetical protein